ncbi:MAG TPA: ATP-dependent helicase [Blastocatellia bacterium]|nr:ATP-dependent helicase [Blastocatellia bacterium]
MKPYILKRPAARRWRINYRAELNDEQYAAVTAGDGPALVIAGAGSGKTRVITYRVAWLIEQGVDPSRILLLTFTNKAAREMLRRVEALLQMECRRLWGGTFHHIGNRILREHAPRLGYRTPFTILDSEDARDLLTACIREAGIDTKKRRFPRGDIVQDILSLSVNTSRTIRETIHRQFSYFDPLADEIERVAQVYAERKLRESLMDYDDLLLCWRRLLVEHPDVAALYADQFRYILVDEYQDTNRVQAEIVDLLAARHRNVMVVGDDCQTIYSWRGTDFRNIYEFPERYPDARIYHLETNYRSTPQILALANASIAHNRRQFPKGLRAVRRGGPKPALVPARDVNEQAEFVAARILELYADGVPLSEMAVLYRSHYHSMELQIELLRRGIPYTVRSGLRFFEQAHIKDVLAYLRAVVNPLDELAWLRILKMVPGIGQRTATEVWKAIAAAADWVSELPLLPARGVVPRRAQPGWTAFVELMQALAADEMMTHPSAQIALVLSSEYIEHLRTTYANAETRAEDLRQLATFATQYRSTESFLSEVALLGQERFSIRDGLYGEEILAAGAPDEPLVLSSIHQAKGLEWRIVFLIWAAEGRFPTARSYATEETFEEERRLFYVAVTRAKDELYICYPLITREGTRHVVLRPSVFVTEVDEDLFEQWIIEAEDYDQESE